MNTIAFNVSNSNYTKSTDRCFLNDNTPFGHKYVYIYKEGRKVTDETSKHFVWELQSAEAKGKKDQYIEACKNFADKRFNFEPLINAARQKIDALDDLIATKQLNDLIGTLGKNPSEAELFWLDYFINPSPYPPSCYHEVHIGYIADEPFAHTGEWASTSDLDYTCEKLENCVTTAFDKEIDKIIENHKKRKEAEKNRQLEEQLKEAGVFPSTKTEPESEPISKNNCDKPILKFICRILNKFFG